jgi:F-type H+-transporting ATPase subunit b
MPQLDKVTFLSQFFWLCVFYFGFYYIVLKYFLPKFSRILTFRQKKMNLSLYDSHSLPQENRQVRQDLNNKISHGFSLSRTVFYDFLSHTNSWLDLKLTSVNKTNYKTVNNSYIQSLGEASLSQNIMFYHTSTQKSENLKESLLVDNIRILRNLRKKPISLSLLSREKKDQTILTKKASTIQENNKKSKKNKKDIK